MIPHKDTLFANAEYAKRKTETCLSGFSQYSLMRWTDFYFAITGEIANLYKPQEKGNGESQRFNDMDK